MQDAECLKEGELICRRGTKKQEGPSICGIEEEHTHLEEAGNGRKAVCGEEGSNEGQ